ncbi:transglutaminase-like cysteine peptidase [Aliiroseovarius sp. KMU-50]|uniref:Transglutaminase-like cysteine peptidase n=1 Tax=Aliiroseovarius salicola TaxID=3009082 RepID=A0ABT4W2W6_9RHOB|nr:transglutaminase-like cysteine peptidase [Aliiroseovarius sp. KMU-50]MDA5094860.1 transglutaminase-like cysteine peptidase [Aliiroseovarius sp. KMU-50]
MKQNEMPKGKKGAISALRAATIVIAGASTLLSSGTAYAAGSYFVPNKGQVSAPPGARALCKTYQWACSSSRKQAAIPGEMQLVSKINSYVNRTTKPIEDSRQYGVKERWAMPTRRGGDCEDYVLAKKHALIGRGISPQRLLIATVLDRKRNSHAVLVYRSAQGDLILDNVTNRIKTWKDTRYLFLRMQDPNNPAHWVNVFSGG